MTARATGQRLGVNRGLGKFRGFDHEMTVPTRLSLRLGHQDELRLLQRDETRAAALSDPGCTGSAELDQRGEPSRAALPSSKRSSVPAVLAAWLRDGHEPRDAEVVDHGDPARVGRRQRR